MAYKESRTRIEPLAHGALYRHADGSIPPAHLPTQRPARHSDAPNRRPQ